MNDDIKRLRQWMEENHYSMKRLARMMDIPYITVHTVIERRGSTTDQFVNRFIRAFGYEVAKEVFQLHLAPVVAMETA